MVILMILIHHEQFHDHYLLMLIHVSGILDVLWTFKFMIQTHINLVIYNNNIGPHSSNRTLVHSRDVCLNHTVVVGNGNGIEYISLLSEYIFCMHTLFYLNV